MYLLCGKYNTKHLCYGQLFCQTNGFPEKTENHCGTNNSGRSNCVMCSSGQTAAFRVEAIKLVFVQNERAIISLINFFRHIDNFREKTRNSNGRTASSNGFVCILRFSRQTAEFTPIVIRIFLVENVIAINFVINNAFFRATVF